jgi:hypothetical protein
MIDSAWALLDVVLGCGGGLGLGLGLEVGDGVVELADLELQRPHVLHGLVQHVGRVGGLLHVGHQVLQLLHALADARPPHALGDAARVRRAAALRPRSHLHVVVVVEAGRRGCCRGGQARVPDEPVLRDVVEPKRFRVVR